MVLSLPQLPASLLVAVAVLLLLDHRRRHPVLLLFLVDLWHSPQAHWAAWVCRATSPTRRSSHPARTGGPGNG